MIGPSETTEVVATVIMGIFYLAGAGFAWVVSPLRPWTRAALIVGGLLAVLQEPMIDALAQVRYAPAHLGLVSAFGVDMPVWPIFAYGLLLGVVPQLIGWLVIRRGWSLKSLRALAVGLIVLDFVWEGLLFHLDFYKYGGPQPLRLLGVPFYWPVVNAAGFLVVSLLAVPLQLAMRRKAALGLAPPLLFAGVVTTLAWPVFTAMVRTDDSRAVVWLAALVVFAAGLFMIDTVLRGIIKAAMLFRAATPVGAR